MKNSGRVKYWQQGKHWEMSPATRSTLPALVCAYEATYTAVRWNHRIRNPCWVLDYHYTRIRQRVGSLKAEWTNRPAHCAHLFPPGVSYWSDLRSARKPVRTVFITFRRGDMAGLDTLINPRYGYARIVDPGNKLGAVLMRIARIGHEQGDTGFWEAQSLFYEIIRQLLRSVPIDTYIRQIPATTSLPAPPSFVERAKKYMRNYLSEPLRIRNLAKHCGVSPSYFAHRYRSEAQETPMQSLSAMRVECVKGLLVQGLPLKSIAEMTGFCDLYHLSKAFKRHEGLSPRQFLRQLRCSASSSR